MTNTDTADAPRALALEFGSWNATRVWRRRLRPNCD